MSDPSDTPAPDENAPAPGMFTFNDPQRGLNIGLLGDERRRTERPDAEKDKP